MGCCIRIWRARTWLGYLVVLLWGVSCVLAPLYAFVKLDSLGFFEALGICFAPEILFVVVMRHDVLILWLLGIEEHLMRLLSVDPSKARRRTVCQLREAMLKHAQMEQWMFGESAPEIVVERIAPKRRMSV